MRRISICAVVLLFASTGLAAGQATTTGSVSGEITDSTGAVLPGVTVTVSNNQGTKVFVSGRSGGYLAPFLTPGIYAFEVELQGFRSVEQTGVVVGLGQTIELDFVMSVGSVTERVQVTGASPVVDVQATSAGGLLDSEVLKHLPVGRNFTQTLYLVPGVSSSGQVGDQNPAISGASGLENQYVVDGVNITNTGYGGVGSYSIVFGSLGNGVTTDFIQETQVQTAGFEAEYGQATGGVVNVITKSGSNLFSGSAYGFVRAGGTEGDWKNLQTPNGTVNTTERSFADVGVTAGGRLVEDRLFFFGALNPQWQNRTFVAPDGFALVGSGPQERKRRIYSYAGKLTYQAAAAHRIDASFFGDPSEGLNGLQRASGLLAEDLAPRISALDTYGAHNQVVKYDAILSSNFLFEASFARNDEEFAETPALQEWAVTDRTVVPSVRTGGFGFYERGTKGLSLQYQVKATNLIDGGNGGTHQVRYGVAYEDINYDRLINRTGPTFTLHNGATTLTGASVSVLNAPELAGGKLWRVTRANTSNQNATTQQYVSFFAQDTWQVGNLTVRPGVRYEQQDLRGDPDTPLCREGETRPGRGDGSGALKPCSFKWDGNWAARVGTSYDLIGDGRSKLYANWGRFYAKIPNDLAARAMSADAAATRADYADANLTMPIQTGTVAGGTTVHFREAGLHAAEIDPDSRSTFKDEFVTGVEFEALPAVNVGFRYIYRNMTQVLEDVGQTTLTDFYSNPAAAFASVEYFITNPTTSTSVNSGTGRFEEPVHNYHAFEVTANKRLSNNWALISSYRYSRLRGTFEGFYRNDNGQSDPAITSLYDFPTNSVDYTQIGVPQFGFRGDIRNQGALGSGPLPNDRGHQVKIFGNYIWNDLNVGIGLDSGSGAPLTTLAANPVYDNSGEIPEGARGSGVQTIDGFRETTPFRTFFDVHLDYTVRLPNSNQRLVLIMDAFNLFDNQDPDLYDYASEQSFGVVNPNGPLGTAGAFPISADVGSFPSYNPPRSLQFGARYEW